MKRLRIPSTQTLIRELAFVLALKLVLLFALWWSFFRGSALEVDEQAISQALIGNATQSQQAVKGNQP